MAVLTESDVLALIRRELKDPFSEGARALKRQVPGYLEINPPDLLLNQTLGWSAHIGNNGQQTASQALTLTTTAAAITGASTTLYHAGDYVITGLFEWSLTASGAARAAGTAANVDNAGAPNAWSNVNNAKVQDTTYATVDTAGTAANCDFLRLTNLGFTVPAGTSAAPVGVTVTVRGKVDSTSNAPTWRTTLVVGGSEAGSTKTTGAHGTDTDEVFGGAADLWGTTLTAAQVTASDFGVDINCSTTSLTRTFSVDYVSIALTWGGTLTNDMVGYLYVSGSPYGVAPQIGSMPVGTRALGWEWFVQTTSEDVPIGLYSKQGYTEGVGTATTNTSMIIARLR